MENQPIQVGYKEEDLLLLEPSGQWKLWCEEEEEEVTRYKQYEFAKISLKTDGKKLEALRLRHIRGCVSKDHRMLYPITNSVSKVPGKGGGQGSGFFDGRRNLGHEDTFWFEGDFNCGFRNDDRHQLDGGYSRGMLRGGDDAVGRYFSETDDERWISPVDFLAYRLGNPETLNNKVTAMTLKKLAGDNKGEGGPGCALQENLIGVWVYYLDDDDDDGDDIILQ